MLALVSDYCLIYERLRLLFVSIPIVVGHFSNLVLIFRASEFIHSIAVSEFFVGALLSFLLSALADHPTHFTSFFTDLEDIP